MPRCESRVSALSDSFGRKHLQTWGRVGVVFFYWCHKFRDRSLLHRFCMEIGCWGVLSAGAWPIFAASHSDLFGGRPELSSRIQAADGLWTNAVGVTGLLIPSLLTRTIGLEAGQAVSAVLVAVVIMILHSMPETLPVSERKPFKLGEFLTRANPLSNIFLLFGSGAGPGLRRLSVSAMLFFFCQHVWAIQSAFRLGFLGWTSTQMQCPHNYWISIENANKMWDFPLLSSIFYIKVRVSGSGHISPQATRSSAGCRKQRSPIACCGGLATVGPLSSALWSAHYRMLPRRCACYPLVLRCVLLATLT